MKVSIGSTTLLLAVCLVFTFSLPALAYVGPGAGVTMLGALWGVIVAIVLAVVAIFYWPIRALLRRRRNGSGKKAKAGSSAGE